METIILVWIFLLIFLGIILYFLRGLAHPQKMTYPDKISQGETSKSMSDEPFLSFPTQIFNPFQKSHKVSHLHHEHSIKTHKNTIAGFFPHQKAQKSKIPDTTHLKNVVDRHERHKKPKHHTLKPEQIPTKQHSKPLHAIEKIALIEELRQMVNKK
jgi:hypothetical protein